MASVADGRKSPVSSVVQIAEWSQHQWLRAGFSTRLGGASTVYGEGDLNLGWTASDPAKVVARNRERLLELVADGSSFELVTARQFHSNLIRHIDSDDDTLATGDRKAVLRGDALMTDVSGLMLGIQTADCVPVLVADAKQRVVAAFHAGWRGTLARIVERGIGDFMLRYGSQSADMVAAIGPCIGACCFAVGEEVRTEFQSQFDYVDSLFSSLASPDDTEAKPAIHLDLVEANRRQLLDAGVAARSIVAVGECTACTTVQGGRRKYFSHRAERGFTGRMLSVIGVASD